MACNGFGHPPDCDCGWGGEFYGKIDLVYSLDYWQTEMSNTKPNAKCPVCGDSVFFYRSPGGGAVYFDCLGPPWPKHLCTDQDQTKISSAFFPSLVKKDGWFPFLCKQILPMPQNEGLILFDVQERWLILIRAKYSKIRYGTPIWIKAVPGKSGEYEVSTLRTKNGNTYEVIFRGYNANALQEFRLSSKLSETIKLLNKAGFKIG